MYRISKTVRAERELEDIYYYGLIQWGAAQADRYHEELTNAMEQLADNPKLGKAMTRCVRVIVPCGSTATPFTTASRVMTSALCACDTSSWTLTDICENGRKGEHFHSKVFTFWANSRHGGALHSRREGWH